MRKDIKNSTVQRIRFYRIKKGQLDPPYNIRKLTEFPFKYFRIKIEKSSIPNAGLGVFVIDRIPKHYMCPYKGIFYKTEDDYEPKYSWVLYDYDKETGELYPDDYKGFVDASNIDKSNMTRFVNCGMKQRLNNMLHCQIFDKILYVTKRDIKSGEELFIDYGEDYRQTYLNISDDGY